MPILYPLFMLMLVIFITAACIGEDPGLAYGTVDPGTSPVAFPPGSGRSVLPAS